MARAALSFPVPAAEVGEAVGRTADEDSTRGLYDKYRVERRYDPTGKHRTCRYFVLDLMHDKFSPAALAAYADACTTEYPQLAVTLRTLGLGPKETGR